MSESLSPVVTRSKPRLSWAWLLPLLAAAATAWLFWTQWKSQGPEIHIRFDDAPGLQAGKSLLIYRGVKVGKVTSVWLDTKADKVIVSVRLTEFARELARQGTDFWIDQPELSLHQATGLDAIVQGNSIHARLGNGPVQTTFDGLATEPITPLNKPALLIKLRADSIPFLSRGTPVYYHGVAVGSVRDKRLDKEGKPYLQIIVDTEHATTVLSTSRFWILPATSLHIDGNGANINVAGVAALIEGGIAFDQFIAGGTPVKTDTEFKLSPTEASARADGPRFAITFDDGRGLVAGQTPVCYLGQPVGLVESVTVSPNRAEAKASVRLNSEFSAFAKARTIFTLVRPRVSLQGVSGLDTIVTGPYIAAEPAPGDSDAGTQFVGRTVTGEEWEKSDAERDGIHFTLSAENLPNLTAGASILHRGVPVGSVLEKTFDANGRPLLKAVVRREYRDLVRASSRFWRVPATAVTAGPGVLKVEVQDLVSLVQGGIAFEAFGSSAAPATENSSFPLFGDEQTARAISEPVRITFTSGRGLLPNQSQLRYLGVPVGVVESIQAANGKVEVTARFQDGYAFLRRKGSTFALIQPQITLQGISGIETLISGVYIDCLPGTDEQLATSFSGKISLDPQALERKGFEVRVAAASTELQPGAQVVYRDLRVGEVIAKALSSDGKQVILTALIDPQYRSLLRENSRFYDASGLEGSLGFIKLQVKAPGILATGGRLAFTNPDLTAKPASEGYLFSLQSKPRQ